MTSTSARISPTAHYTGEVWHRHGLSDPRLATVAGRIFHAALKPAMDVSQRLGGPTLEAFLLARHQLIDHRLKAGIESGAIRQVIEIASGLSPRGCRFSETYGDRITYVETDLPPMAALKARRLGLGSTGSHQVRTLDALATSGENSLTALCRELDPEAGTVIITEGLINYFPVDAVLALWSNVTAALAKFPSGLYLSDIHCRSHNSGPLVSAFVAGLSTFVRGRVGLLFDHAEDARQHLQECGFAAAELLRPSDFGGQVEACAQPWADLVRVIEARTQKMR